MSNDDRRKYLMESKGITLEEANEIIKQGRKRAKQRKREWQAQNPGKNFVSYAPGTEISYGNDLYQERNIIVDITLQTTLSMILTQLANFFGMTTEVIAQNAPYWLAKYGWYAMTCWLPFAFVMAAGITVIIFCILIYMLEVDFKHPYLTFICIFFVTALICVGICVSQCAIAPEIYGLRALIHDLSNLK